LAGFVVWLIGVYFKAVGDWLVKTFLADPTRKGQQVQIMFMPSTRPLYILLLKTHNKAIGLVCVSVARG
jgi:steroid 5-alpha reductase family enzyme